MTKQDLIDVVSEKNGLTKKASKEVIETIFGAISGEVVSGGRVTLVNFGTFTSKYRNPRRGVLPGTRYPIEIPGRQVPIFKPGMHFRKEVAKNN
jgi:nucleoid DNA-binding protein